MYFVHVYIKKKKKKIQHFQIFPKKREKFSKKKKKIWTRDIGLPSDFFKKGPFFFLSKISRWYMRIPWTKLFLNCGV